MKTCRECITEVACEKAGRCFNGSSAGAPLEIASSRAALAPATGWPGLVFWLGPGVFRGLGYFALLLAGICMAKKDPFWIFVFELLVGHFLICAAEVIGQMNHERNAANAGDVARGVASKSTQSKT